MIAPEQPAFPEVHIYHFMTDAEGKQVPAVVPRWGGGLTKREYFAAMAMQAIIASGNLTAMKDLPSIVAKASCEYVDALIAELSK